jgi:hypothetical protein
MKVISQAELDREFEYLEKQKTLLKQEREKIMLERSRLYYQWKEIQETDESIQKDQERVNRLRGDLENELQKVNKEQTEAIEKEIAKIRKEKNDELEEQLAKDRKRLDKIRFDIAEIIGVEEARLQEIKKKNLI